MAQEVIRGGIVQPFPCSPKVFYVEDIRGASLDVRLYDWTRKEFGPVETISSAGVFVPAHTEYLRNILRTAPHVG